MKAFMVFFVLVAMAFGTFGCHITSMSEHVDILQPCGLDAYPAFVHGSLELSPSQHGVNADSMDIGFLMTGLYVLLPGTSRCHLASVCMLWPCLHEIYNEFE